MECVVVVVTPLLMAIITPMYELSMNRGRFSIFRIKLWSNWLVVLLNTPLFCNYYAHIVKSG
jgi:hypothetical protein